MFARRTVAAAILLYVAVLGCVMWPGAGRPRAAEAAQGEDVSPATLTSLNGLPYCGVAMQLQRVDWVEDYKKSIDEIADLGADTVSFVVDARQEDGYSTEIYVDMRKTLTVPQLLDLIGHAKARKLRVVLMPIVLLDKPKGSQWRGSLEPDHNNGWDDWFDSYREMISHYARIARDGNVDVLVVGSELVTSEPKKDQWIRTIKTVRDIYKGQLTYSSNWDHYESVPFWRSLDLIGMNSYWWLGADHNVSVDQIEARWKKPIQSDLFAWLEKEKLHKPLILLEAGWCSLANAANEPWDYTKDELDADPDLQRRMYEAFYKSWWGKPQFGGFMMWEWHPGGDDTGKGYTPRGKPAEQLMRDWFAKPRWTVQP